MNKRSIKRADGGPVARTVRISKKTKPHFMTGSELESYEKPELHREKENINRRYADMKQEVLTFMADLKSMRKDCVECCANICRDANYSHEGRINSLTHNVTTLKAFGADRSAGIIGKLENKIAQIDQEEADTLRGRMEDAGYHTRLNSVLSLLKNSAEKLSDADITAAVQQFENDPLAIQAIRDTLTPFGMEKTALAPADHRGERQAVLRDLIGVVRGNTALITDVSFSESGFAGSTEVNGYYISNGSLSLFDTAWIESLTDDCTAVQPEQPAAADSEFSFQFTGVR